MQFAKVRDVTDPASGFAVKDTVVLTCEILDCVPWFEASVLTGGGGGGGAGLSQSPHTASLIAHTPTDTFFFIVSGTIVSANVARDPVLGITAGTGKQSADLPDLRGGESVIGSLETNAASLLADALAVAGFDGGLDFLSPKGVGVHPDKTRLRQNQGSFGNPAAGTGQTYGNASSSGNISGGPGATTPNGVALGMVAEFGKILASLGGGRGDLSMVDDSVLETADSNSNAHQAGALGATAARPSRDGAGPILGKGLSHSPHSTD